MPQTTSAAMINPEVWGDMAQAQFTGAVRVGGSPAVVEDNSLEGVPGDTIHFPKWGALGELDNLTEGTPMNTTAMSTDAATATIKEAGKAVEITDRARLIALGDPEARSEEHTSELQSREKLVCRLLLEKKK